MTEESSASSSILQGAAEALEHAKGKRQGFKVHVPASVNVKALRAKLKMTQKEFSDRFGFSVYTLRHWEHGTRTPEGSARAYLTVIERDPDSVLKALEA